jgi:hypothetical protein
MSARPGSRPTLFTREAFIEDDRPRVKINGAMRLESLDLRTEQRINYVVDFDACDSEGP